jgi:very-short-patch-repair endonuclease
MWTRTSRPPEAALAEAQYGVVSRQQLLAAGHSSKQIGHRLRTGRLVQLHRGVYAVGHRRLTREGVWLAAVLASGDGAVLSHRDAAALYGLGRSNRGPVEVTTPRQAVGTPAMRVRHRRALDPVDVTIVRRIPVTTLPRTLVDLAEVLRRDQLAAALTAAERDHRLDAQLLDEAIARTNGRPGHGHARLRAVLDEHAARGVQLTRSELEIALRRIVREQRLPVPRLNVWIPACGVEVDALWPAERLAVEADSWRWHHDRAAFQRDRAKANALQLAGYRVLRFTHDDIVRRPAHTAATIRAALGER